MKNTEISCMQSDGPYHELLKAAKSRDYKTFESLVNNPATDLMSTEYYVKFDENTRGWFGTILDVCCLMPNDMIRILLSFDDRLDVNHLNETVKKAPIHLAAMNDRYYCDVLDNLLNHPQTDINLPDGNGNTILHIYAMHPKILYSRIYSLLLYDKINPNLLNNAGESPLYIVVKLNKKDCEKMKIFLECPGVDFDMVVQDQPLRKVIEESYPDLFPFAYLIMKDTKRFFAYVTSRKYSNETLETHAHFPLTYLQYACKQGLTNVVKFLLLEGVNPNGMSTTHVQYACKLRLTDVGYVNDDTGKMKENCISSPIHPLCYAVDKGVTDIIKLFINRTDLIYPITGNEKEDSDMSAIITHILRVLIDRSNSNENINFDSSFNFLLSKFSKNPELDINYLDENGFTCLHTALVKKNMKYVFSLLDHGANIALKKPNGKCLFDYIERNTIEPYLNSCVKQHGSQILFLYNFMSPPKECNKYFEDYYETDLLMDISQNPNLKTLLQHPILSTFINIKWSQIKEYYFINLIFYALFWVSLNTYIYLIFILPFSKIMQWILWVFVLLFLIIFFIREGFQLILSPKKYVSVFENWMEISIIVLTAGLLFDGLSMNIRNSFSGILILMTWGVLLNMLGRLPKFAIAVAMFKVVTKNFFKYFPFYLLLLASFSFSLYVLFNGIRNSGERNKSTDLTGVWFSSLWNTFFKTVVMLSGELEVSNMPFSENNTKISQIVVVLCIIVIPIIIANLLNGLAVGDIKQIMDEAEVIGLISKLNFINAFEKNSFIVISERRNYRNKRYISFITRLFLVKLSIFRNVLHENCLKIFKKGVHYFVKISWNIDVRIDDDIIEKSKSIITLNEKVQQYENDSLFLEIEKVNQQINQKIDQKFNELCILINQK